jgi:hypothetical protein
MTSMGAGPSRSFREGWSTSSLEWERGQSEGGTRLHRVSSGQVHAEQPPAADCLQRPLLRRVRFRQRLRRSVRPIIEECFSWYGCSSATNILIGKSMNVN